MNTKTRSPRSTTTTLSPSSLRDTQVWGADTKPKALSRWVMALFWGGEGGFAGVRGEG